MPSEVWPDPRFPQPGIAPDVDETAPEIDGPSRRTSPKTLLLSGIGVGVLLVFSAGQFLLASAASSQDSSSGVNMLVFLGLALLGAAASMAGWWVRTYQVGTEELVIDEGILSRRRRIVPYGRIQQIDIDQRLFAQLLNLGTLTIETAGSAGGTVRLGMLDIRLARGIRRFALQRRAEIHQVAHPPGAAPTPADTGLYPGVAPKRWPPPPTGAAPEVTWPPPPVPAMTAPADRVLIRLGFWRLAIAGLTHHYVIAALPALLVGALIIGAFAVPENPGTSPIVVLLIAVGIAIAVAAGLSALVFIQYVVGQYGYTLSEQGDDLHLHFGLLQVRSVTIPRRRVQHLTVSDNPLRRALGLVSIELHSAAPTVDASVSTPVFGGLFRGLQSLGGAGADFEIPILARRDVDALLYALMGADWHIPDLTLRPAVALRRAITRRTGLLVLAMLIPAFMFPPGSLLLFGVALIGIPWGVIAHRRAGYAQGNRVVVLARGVFHHRIDLLPYNRIQSAYTLSSPFQRMAGLDTLHVNVAGRSGDPNLFDMPHGDAFAYSRGLPRHAAATRGPSVAGGSVYGAPPPPA